jgi:hypothetical protein
MKKKFTEEQIAFALSRVAIILIKVDYEQSFHHRVSGYSVRRAGRR